MSTSAIRRYRIAVIAGDGIGPEVIAEGCRALERVAGLYGFHLEFHELPWGSDYYRRHGTMMPADAAEALAPFDSAYFGAAGAPDVPDHVTAGGLILALRREFDLYVNLRPVRLFEGVHGPTRADPSEVDFVVVRENSEGEYVQMGGRHRSGELDLALQASLFSASGVGRIVRYAFELARRRDAQNHAVQVTSVTKSNALGFGMTLWDDVAASVAAEFAEVRWDRMHVDAVAYRLVKDPSHFDVLVASNLFGDILSDLGAALHGSLGLSPSANLRPGGKFGIFEPVHGSAPDISGRGLTRSAQRGRVR